VKAALLCVKRFDCFPHHIIQVGSSQLSCVKRS
jgi:hypothetical protein